MDVPSPAAGVVKDVKVKVGDKVSEGTLDPDAVERAGAAQPQARKPRRVSAGVAQRPPRRLPRRPAAPAAAKPPAAPAPARSRVHRQRRHRMRDARARRGPRRLQRRIPRRRSRHEDGAGRALRDARRRVPQRRLHSVQGAAARRRRDGRGDGRWPITASRSAAPQIDPAKLAAWKNKVVGKLTGGLAGMAKARKVEVVRGIGTFVDPHHLEVEITEGRARQTTGAKKVVPLRQGDHRRRLAVDPAAVRARGSAHPRFHRRARSRARPEAAC